MTVEPPVKIDEATLSNGLRILGIELPHLHSVQMNIFARGGDYYDGEERWGVSHLIEHIILRGNLEYPEPENMVARIGGSYNGSIGPDCIDLNAYVHPDHLTDIMRLFGSLIQRPQITDEVVEVEKRIIANELDSNAGSIEQLVDDIIERETTPDLKQGFASDPNTRQFESITKEQVAELHSRYYSASNMVISVAGRFDFGEAVAAAQEFFGALPAGVAIDYQWGAFSPGLPVIDVVPFGFNPARLTVSFCGPTKDFQWPQFYALDDYLINTPDSLLFQEVRQGKGLCYRLTSDLDMYRDFYRYRLDFDFQPGNLKELHQSVFGIIDRLKNELISEEIVASLAAKRQKSVYMVLDDPEYMAGSLGHQELIHGRVIMPFDIVSGMNDLDGRAVRDYARQILSFERMHIAVAADYGRREYRDAVRVLHDSHPEARLSESTSDLSRVGLVGRILGLR